jgi:hypothetical protein
MTPQSEKKVWVMVETISTMRHRYMIETPEDHPDWAMDSVVMEDADEFSQKYIGEKSLEYKILSEAEVLSICDEDNDCCQSWSDEKKIEVFCNRM